MQLLIPGHDKLQLTQLVLDFNGTIALDGMILPDVREKLNELAKLLKIFVLTADSNGSAAKECEGLPVELHVIGQNCQREEKRDFVRTLTPGVVVLGNGVNDELMFLEADLSIAVIGREGCATATLMSSTIVVTDIIDGLNLLLMHHRLIPTLRK
ncbi:soluble P-type ATPase [Paenibacillus taihuensis]|uniref:Soluble P-type ATPase n=1 Tax=Paenibacillus taihuensis TaxID=1156355 RepID=A0A3D9SFE1_9BACL|nr:HAD family hydrolase [Paenibacillus taihuensis]REE94622.1 soluble P-type ATPase [Paenibacillus taihuensis]